jgi:hypothetical protein
MVQAAAVVGEWIGRCGHYKNAGKTYQVSWIVVTRGINYLKRGPIEQCREPPLMRL